MRRHLVILLGSFLLTACGGEAIAAGGDTIPAGGETIAASGTDGPAVAATPPARSSQAKDLAISCHFAARQLRVTCTAAGYTEGARLYWWSNSEPAEAEGAKFDFAVTKPVPNLTVSFEECNSGKCQTVTTTLDTTKAAATVVIKPGQVVQIPMAPAINPDGSPKQSRPQAAPPTSKPQTSPASIAAPDPAPTFKTLAEHATFPDDVKTAFQSSVDTHFEAATDKAGIAVAVYQNGRLWEYATGNAQTSVPMTVNTPILIRSVSKTLIAPLILNQVGIGAYKLSDTISDVLDGHPAHNLIDSNFINPDVTVAQLLHMKSGLSDYGENKGSDYTSVQTAGSWAPIDLLALVQSPYQTPGEYSYSNTNTLLLGLIAEHHGGQPLNRLLKQTFFDPLEISAGLLPQDAAPPNTARPHGDRGAFGGEGFGDLSELSSSWLDDWVLQTNRTTWIGGGGVTTAGNSARWGYELFSEQGRALTPTVRAQLLESFVGDPVFMGVTLLYGYHVTKLTLELNDGKSLTLYGHPGSGYGYTSILYYSPQLDISVSVLANSHSNIRGGGPENTALSHATLYSVLRDICVHYAQTTDT